MPSRLEYADIGKRRNKQTPWPNRPRTKAVTRRKPPENKYLLDEISEESVIRGIEGDNRICALHFKLFFSLEAQRVRHYEELIEAIRSSVRREPIQINGWSRAVTVKWTNNPLSAVGSLTHIGGRFNYGRQINEHQFTPFPALYITKANSLRKVIEIMSTFVKDEVIDDLAKLAGKEPIPLVRQPGELKRLLHDPYWRGAPTQINLPAAPQIFGKIVRDAGVEGIQYNSTKAKDGNCLAVFPENLEGSPSSIALADEPPKSNEHRTLDKDTWRSLV